MGLGTKENRTFSSKGKIRMNLPEALIWIFVGLGFVLLPVMAVWFIIISAVVVGVSAYLYHKKRKREAVWEGKTQ